MKEAKKYAGTLQNLGYKADVKCLDLRKQMDCCLNLSKWFANALCNIIKKITARQGLNEIPPKWYQVI